MRGNNKRKLIEESLLAELLDKFQQGVPVARLVRDYELDISLPHLRKLLFIYINILDEGQDANIRKQLHNAIFPAWNNNGVSVQPDRWTYSGKFPFGTWGVRIKP